MITAGLVHFVKTVQIASKFVILYVVNVFNVRWGNMTPSLVIIPYLGLTCFSFKGTTQAKKFFYYSFDSDGNFHAYVKSKIKWGNRHEVFSIFFIENQLFTENVRKGGSR